MQRVCGLGLVIVLIALSANSSAGPEKVSFPAGYVSTFVRYATVDKPERDPAIVRFLYVNPKALARAVPNAPLPHGTVIVMEDHKAHVDAAGDVVGDDEGRFVPTADVTNVFVQEKQEGWGVEYADDVRNGEWEYAWFEADGSRKVGDFVKFDGCFACHKENAAGQDYNFTLSPFVADIKR